MTMPTYTVIGTSGYNASPPADDGTQVAPNLGTWSGVKTKLADPIKTLADAMETSLNSVIGSIYPIFRASAAKSSAYPVVAGDNGVLFLVSGTTTLTLPAASTAGDGYRIGVLKTDAAGTNVTVALSGADTINGSTSSLVLRLQYEKVILVTNGTTWYLVSPTVPILVQNAVSAYHAGASNVTGDGTVYTVTWGTESYDKGSDFASNAFTAPVTAKYHIDVFLDVGGHGAGHTAALLKIVATGQTYQIERRDPSGNTADFVMRGSLDIAMTAGDTFTVTLTVSGSTLTVDTDGGAAPICSKLNVRIVA